MTQSALFNGLGYIAIGIACLVMWSNNPTECGIGTRPGNFTSNDGTFFEQTPGILNGYTYRRSNGVTGTGTYSGPGYPPLRDWIFGTGIAYLIIGACQSVFGLLILFTIIGAPIVAIVLLSSAGFTFAWMIVGAVSLWRDGYDCVNINFPLWQMGMAAVILSIIMCCSSTGSSRSNDNNN